MANILKENNPHLDEVREIIRKTIITLKNEYVKEFINGRLETLKIMYSDALIPEETEEDVALSFRINKEIYDNIINSFNSEMKTNITSSVFPQRDNNHIIIQIITEMLNSEIKDYNNKERTR